ncbi:TPA: phage head morphogenesis protein [Haemophilus influenzae]|uniref:phage head morphogenesis protein n=1 Tax=Haemophilus influenzae TaxID=727 RepID=UPI001F024DE0|nr:phage minor head protein [Haemophilus influenzae]
MNLPEILKNQRAKARKFKPVKMSKRTELWYKQQLKQFVKTMTDDVEIALQQPQGSFFMDDAKGFQAISARALMKVLEKYEKSDRTSQAENIANGFVSRGDVQNHIEVSTNLKNQTGIDLAAYLRNSPNIAEKVNALTAGNIQLIKSIRSQYLDKVQNAVMQAMVRGSLNKDLAAQIKDLGKTTEKRAMFIARDQSSKLNAALTQARHEEVGVKKYMWSTSGDERVRESHAEKDGQIFEYSNPPADPGHDFNCWCVQIPVLDDSVSQKEISKDGEVKSQENREPKELPISESTTELATKLKEINVEHRPVKDLDKELSFNEILNKLSGGDMTQGSCVSLALSYIGNKIGLDVTDYRGGDSCKFFSRDYNIMKLFSASGIKSKVIEVERETSGTAEILNELTLNKEYYLSTGRHAAIVRRGENGLEYLEMQSAVKNGWMPFTKYGTVIKTLRNRFGCQSSIDKYGFKSNVILAEVDSFKARKGDLRKILGYINTSPDKQKKGSWGSER